MEQVRSDEVSRSDALGETSHVNELPSSFDLASGRWQMGMLPLMKATIVGLTIFFFVASFFQLLYLQSRMQSSPPANMNAIFSVLNDKDSPNYQEKLAATKLKANIYFEQNIVARRYQQAGILLMAGVWVRYMGFITGMILAMVGAIFILGKLKEQRTDLSAKVRDSEVKVGSTSPGIILCTLGAVLMGLTVAMQQQHDVLDAAVYFNGVPAEERGLDTTGKPPLHLPANIGISPESHRQHPLNFHK
jgi:hypothetical protein